MSMPEKVVFRSTTCGSMIFFRLNVRSWLITDAARSPALLIPSISFRLGSSFPRRCSAIPLYPLITVRRLLKSWAIPPVSCPTASIFCAWRSCSSAFFRSAISCSIRRFASDSARNWFPRCPDIVLNDRASSSNSSPLWISTRLSNSPWLIFRVPSRNLSRGERFFRICPMLRSETTRRVSTTIRTKVLVKVVTAANAAALDWLTTTVQFPER